MRVRGAVLRAMGLPKPYVDSQPLEIVDLELDPPGPGELLVRVGAAGLCHSDLSVIDGSRPRVMPMVLGHEAAGEVVGTGGGTPGFAEGDHVVLSFVPTCGDCGPCRAGRAALCEPGAAANAAGSLLSGGRRWSEPNAPGSGHQLHHHLGVSAFADHVVVSAHSAVKIDPSLPHEIAALFGCAVLTGVGAAVNSAQVAEGDRVVVFGLGGVGLAALLGAKMAGAAEIIAVDVVEDKLEHARRLGATPIHAGDSVVEAVREATGGGGDKVIETVGSARVLAQAYEATRRGGTTVTVGLPHPEQRLDIQAVSLVTEERTLKGSYLGSCVPERDIPKFVRAYQDGRLPVQELLTHRITIDEINVGFDRLAAGAAVRQAVIL
ncbi:MAG TPA: zinc-binding dehydrogenase [Baekduia sp.]|jgi:alcohol dehydrogenase